MSTAPEAARGRTPPWRNRSPGDLSTLFPETFPGEPAAAVAAASAAFAAWAALPLAQRVAHLRTAQKELLAAKEHLAHGIALETGKPITEALGEAGAVIAKFDLTIADAERLLAEDAITDGPHPALILRRPRGPAAIVAPFNFPLHLGHGAAVAHLLAGNPIVFKPSPFAANVAAEYAAIMAAALPAGVFGLLQGGAAESLALCQDARIRSVCFTGSIAAGRTLATALAEDFAKDLALELGGNNALIVCADADLDAAAAAAAEGACLTAGQRCNATSRVIVEREVAEPFQERLLAALQVFAPGNPLEPETKLGPLISEAAVARYERLLADLPGTWVLPGKTQPEVGGKRGHFVHPAVILRSDDGADDEEMFVPIVSVFIAEDRSHAVQLQAGPPFGLTASIFTQSEATFREIGAQLEVGNLYANLPTTFSPSTLPFGGLRSSGNGRPGGRGFLRFTTDEQAVQWKAWPDS